MSPGFLPVLVAVTDRMARGWIGSAALARVDAHHGIGHPGFDRHDRVLDHGDGRGATQGEVRGVIGVHARHVRHPDRITPVRIVKRLVGDEAVNVGGFNAGVVQTSLDAFQMERMGARVWSLADFSFRDANDGVLAAKV